MGEEYRKEKEKIEKSRLDRFPLRPAQLSFSPRSAHGAHCRSRMWLTSGATLSSPIPCSMRISTEPAMLAWSALPRRDVRRSVPSARTSLWCIKAEAPRPPSLHPPNQGCTESLGASPGIEGEDNTGAHAATMGTSSYGRPGRADRPVGFVGPPGMYSWLREDGLDLGVPWIAHRSRPSPGIRRWLRLTVARPSRCRVHGENPLKQFPCISRLCSADRIKEQGPRAPTWPTPAGPPPWGKPVRHHAQLGGGRKIGSLSFDRERTVEISHGETYWGDKPEP
jgi:hypothetical protein